MPRALVLTVGIGRDVDRSLSLVIDRYRPDFVLLLCSPQSRAFAEKAVQDRSIPADLYFIDVYEETGDVQRLVLRYEEVITDVLLRRGFHPAEVYVDYTRGTKAMSAAVDYVAVALELGTISYIEGDRDAEGRVIAGSERVISFQPAELLFRRSWEDLVRLFNAGHFASVLDRVGELRGRLVRPEHRTRLDLMERLARVCEAWEALDYKGACQGFREILRHGRLPAEVESLGLAHALQRASERVHAIWNCRCTGSECGCGLLLDAPRVALDLLAHADRRAGEHRYDVAVALLYRLMEYTAQRRLHDRGLRADQVRLELLPDEVRNKWASRVGVDGRLKVGLVEGYELLADLGDKVAQGFLEMYRDRSGRLRPCLESRNMSPLAHGFQPVGGDVFDRLREIAVETLLPHVVHGDWNRLLEAYQLPRFPVR